MGAVSWETKGVSTMLMMVAASTRAYMSGSREPLSRPARARTNENSPTWDKPRATARGMTLP
jgi:hypothetical protein